MILTLSRLIPRDVLIGHRFSRQMRKEVTSHAVPEEPFPIGCSQVPIIIGGFAKRANNLCVFGFLYMPAVKIAWRGRLCASECQTRQKPPKKEQNQCHTSIQRRELNIWTWLAPKTDPLFQHACKLTHFLRHALKMIKFCFTLKIINVVMSEMTLFKYKPNSIEKYWVIGFSIIEIKFTSQ